MDYISKMPFIMGASASIVVGIISYGNGFDLKAICVRMTAGMILFFAIGVFLRRFVTNIYEEVKEKNEQEVQNTAEHTNMGKKEHDKSHGIDYRVGGESGDWNNEKVESDQLYDEEFTPLEVSRVTIKDNKQ
ncbi:hypothetical protein [Acetivibrio straminisolvens]|jgi:uncharacterized membrane protein YraQ (UPF0718 family)|uniref:Uncharacterized protein n=1 Tax=Acetivibrio straminisolvens JCM 21531 TaxID=1294263 RepID=W4V857_9FIRM|nr:hypothetical protein [Acetivibrio straminisolvens]GAE88998.1 hypothetical protein JCM21531_2488 [Acetivibrio straminisolvens JCM 21531]